MGCVMDEIYDGDRRSSKELSCFVWSYHRESQNNG